MSRVIDIHCHIATPTTREVAASHRKREYEPYDYYMGATSIKHNVENLIPSIGAQLSDPEARFEYMDRMGVDVQGLSTFVSEYFYWTPGPVGLELSKMQNDKMLQVAADHPDRYTVCGATVPMQDIDLAIAEMERVVANGAKGLQIGGTVNGHNLDEARFRPFWEAVADTGLPVILHPNGYPESQRFDDYFLVNCIGNPLETHTAVTRLIFSGLFEQLPGINLVLLHGGGFLPFYASRADHVWEVRPETRTRIPDRTFSSYLRNLWYDTMVFQPLYLRHLIEVVGSERVMLGTDYPFDMAETDPVGLIDATEGLTDDERAAIKGGTAAQLFGI
ncbi:MAG: amidohydrolase [Acidimicrobiia bacterium]|nr:amidohydrolase [Acidimicrobiia bacterium]MDH4307542.1 amidohydrolase [Acidimicrobiia bacterium]MDH5294934.1 amidohydrolase [Acidimicrobiia bacterium]